VGGRWRSITPCSHWQALGVRSSFLPPTKAGFILFSFFFYYSYVHTRLGSLPRLVLTSLDSLTSSASQWPFPQYFLPKASWFGAGSKTDADLYGTQLCFSLSLGGFSQSVTYILHKGRSMGRKERG
jgi:hypothetical protein